MSAMGSLVQADEYVEHAESLPEGRELESIGAVLIAIHHDLQAIVSKLDTLRRVAEVMEAPALSSGEQ